MRGPSSSFRVFPENEISFNYVPKKYLNSNIQLTSATDQPLAFKIKTNVPVCYLVKPHIGFLPPRASVNVAVTMQPTDYNPQNAAISDKFLINIAPLPSDTDLAALSDPARFQQIWESVPKTLIQSHKLKVALKFEAGSVNTSVIDRAPDDVSRASNQRSTQLDDSAIQQRREESARSSVMHSFVADSSGMGISKETSSGQNVLPRFGNEQGVTTSQGQTQSVGTNIREESKLGTQSFEEKIRILEKRIEEMTNEKKALNQRCQELTGKAEEQQRLLFGLSEENTRLKSELGNLKSSTFKGKSATAGGQSESGTYQSWHVLLAALIALIIGAYLSSSK